MKFIGLYKLEIIELNIKLKLNDFYKIYEFETSMVLKAIR